MRRLIVLMGVAGCGDDSSGDRPDARPDAPIPVPGLAQTAYIKSSQPIHDAHFGNAALSGDGKTLVGAQNNAVTVYVRDGGWRVDADLVPARPGFGPYVAISSDGKTIA